MSELDFEKVQVSFWLLEEDLESLMGIRVGVMKTTGDLTVTTAEVIEGILALSTEILSAGGPKAEQLQACVMEAMLPQTI